MNIRPNRRISVEWCFHGYKAFAQNKASKMVYRQTGELWIKYFQLFWVAMWSNKEMKSWKTSTWLSQILPSLSSTKWSNLYISKVNKEREQLHVCTLLHARCVSVEHSWVRCESKSVPFMYNDFRETKVSSYPFCVLRFPSWPPG